MNYVRPGSGLAIRMHTAGNALCKQKGVRWDDERPKWVFLYTDGRTDTSKEMQQHEMLALCERLEKEAGLDHVTDEYIPHEQQDYDAEMFFLPNHTPDPE